MRFYILSALWITALLNPVFQKYDYGAGFPVVLLSGVALFVLALLEIRKEREKNGREEVFLLLFLVFYALSFVFSQTKNYGLSEVLAFGNGVTLYLLYAGRKNDWMEKFLKVIMVGTFLAVGLGFLLYFFQAEPRMTGPFFNILYHANKWPNAFALYLLMTWPIYIFLHKKNWNFMAGLGLGLIFSAIALTYSRGALLVLFGQIVLFLIYFLGRRSWKILPQIFLVIVLSFGFFFYANYMRSFNHQIINLEQRVTFQNGEDKTSGQERLDFWMGAIKLTEEKPLLGWGPFSFRYAYNGIQKDLLANSDHPHNLLLKFAAENGVITLAAFLGFLIVLLITVVKRFPKLSKEKKDFIYLLGIAVAGCFAHNLIDYNLNFFANLTLLFLLLAFIRSTVIKKENGKSNFLTIFFAVLIAAFSLYEGIIMTLGYGINSSYLAYSNFPRNYYLSSGVTALNDGDTVNALAYANKGLKLNPLDPYLWNLKGEVYCKIGESKADKMICEENLLGAIKLDPLNEIGFYRDYVRQLTGNGIDMSERPFIDKVVKLLVEYFNDVSNNTHFTAYTGNVEAAAELIDIIVPYLDSETAGKLIQGKDIMLLDAERLRKNKSY